MRTATRPSSEAARPDPAPIGHYPLRFAGLAVLLVGTCLLAFGPVVGNGFVDMDDEDGFVKNRHLLAPAGDLVRWAGTSYLQGVYQPLARMMYGGEARLWGVEPGGFHAASLALHCLNAVALLALTVALVRLARPRLPADRPGLVLGLAALSVGLFVVHPLRSEVVAWASVQAYEPSALFAMLSVLAYLRAARSARMGRLAWLSASVALFAGSLGFYAITLCLPLVLVVLDVYPLKRLAPGRCSKWGAAGIVVLEKSPFFALSLAFAALTFQARSRMGTVASLEENGLVSRALASCYGACFYLARTLIPAGLGPIHPAPDRIGLAEPPFALSVLAFGAISYAAYRFRRKWPALAASWVGYLLLQLPTSGLVRFNSTIAADRYSYVTMLWLPALLTAGLCMLLGARPARARLAAVGVAGALVAVASIGLSRAECASWRDSASIWSHVQDSHGRAEGFFESRIGRALADSGRLDEAEAVLENAVRLSPGLGYAHDKLGLVLVARGRTADAYPHFVEAVRLEPNHVEARLNLGYALVQLGRADQAAAQFEEAVRLKPELPDAQANLGAVLVQLGRLAQAEIHLAEALRLAPDRPNGRMDLAYALTKQGKLAEAAELYAEEVRRNPDDRNARHNLNFVRGQLGRVDPNVTPAGMR